MAKVLINSGRILRASAIGISVMSLVTAAHAVDRVEPRTQLAMMHQMNQGGATGGGMMSGQSGSMDAMPGGMRRPEMGGMRGTGGSSGMGEMGMGAMGAAPGAGTSMAMPSALPGFPGASHIYHVGATGFFLDYANKLSFTVDQTTALNGIKQRTLGEYSAAQRKIDESEQALWMITAADQPDAQSVETKLREIEKLRSDIRLAFIRAVGEAAKVLTTEQRRMVLGLAPMPGTPSKH